MSPTAGDAASNIVFTHCVDSEMKQLFGDTKVVKKKSEQLGFVNAASVLSLHAFR